MKDHSIWTGQLSFFCPAGFGTTANSNYSQGLMSFWATRLSASNEKMQTVLQWDYGLCDSVHCTIIVIHLKTSQHLLILLFFFFSRTDSKTINNNAQQRSKTEWSTIVNPECDFVNCAMQNNRLTNTQCLAWFTMFNVLLMLDRDTTLNINDWLRCQRRTIFKKFNILIEY